MKIAINVKCGGFSLSKSVFEELGITDGPISGDINNTYLGIVSHNPDAWRADNRLIMAIEKIGLTEASGQHCELRIVEIPDDVDFEIIEDGTGPETIHEVHRSWN